MNSLFIEFATFIFVFAAICAAYGLGRGGKRARDPHPGFVLIHQYSPPVDVVIEYQNTGGFATLRHLRLLRSLHRPKGGLYLFGLCDRARRPRMFRADRIVSVATPHGEIIDKHSFLVDRLAIPAEFYSRVHYDGRSVRRGRGAGNTA